jgi:hypothetical protein
VLDLPILTQLKIFFLLPSVDSKVEGFSEKGLNLPGMHRWDVLNHFAFLLFSIIYFIKALEAVSGSAIFLFFRGFLGWWISAFLLLAVISSRVSLTADATT